MTLNYPFLRAFGKHGALSVLKGIIIRDYGLLCDHCSCLLYDLCLVLELRKGDPVFENHVKVKVEFV